MRTFTHYALSICAAAALLAGCAGGIVPPHSSVLPGAASNVQPPSAYKVLHSFGNGSDGKYPSARLINVSERLYGATPLGGQYSQGTVFSITPSGMEKVWHSFTSGADGAQPVAGLINVKGMLYGTTVGGGQYKAGTVFSITPSGKEKVLHSFGNGTDGRAPEASLLNVNGTLYGTTETGGQYGSATAFYGTVFSITLSGKEKVLHSFGNGTDGKTPEASLLNVKGTLYGTTQNGGQYGHYGTVLSITPSGNEKVLHSFGNGNDGRSPYASLIDVNRTLYGTTTQGGQYAVGTVFGITPSGKDKVLHSFGNGHDGSGPLASLTAVSGTLYGTTTAGGQYGTKYVSYGTVFSLPP